jgi:hypothetical protein
MGETHGLDGLVPYLLEGRFVATVAGGESCRTAAERDERDRARYAALTGRGIPALRDPDRPRLRTGGGRQSAALRRPRVR